MVGRLVKDPELKRTNADIPVVQFTLAVNRTFSNQNGERQADFISCVVWRGQAENLAKYMRKGSQIGVEGRIQVRNYEDAGGVRRYVTEVVCEQIHFLETKGSREGGYSDVNSYDIPTIPTRNANDPFANIGGFSSSSNETDEDPFASLKTSSGISDDDLPF